MEGFDKTTIMNHILSMLSSVSVKILSTSPSYQVGTQLGVSVEFTNHESTGISFYGLIEVSLPGSSTYYPFYPTTFFTLGANEVMTIPLDYLIPTGVPLGTYNVRIMIGVTNLWYKESLDFEIEN